MISSIGGVHGCLERQELYNPCCCFWHKLGADKRQLFSNGFVIRLEEPVAVEGVGFAQYVPCAAHPAHPSATVASACAALPTRDPPLPRAGHPGQRCHSGAACISDYCIVGEGAFIVPEFPEGNKKFLHFLHFLHFPLRFAS